MDIIELLQLTRWIDREIVSEQIVERYTALSQALQVNSRGNQARQPFEDLRNDLLTALSAIPVESLSIQQFDFLSKIGLGNNVGAAAVSKIEDTLFRNAIDVATAAGKLSEMTQQVAEGVAKAKAHPECASYFNRTNH